MPRLRKRKRHGLADEALTNNPSSKKMRIGESQNSISTQVPHPVLSLYYARVQSLREYVISKLPSSSRIRRRKVSAVGVASQSPAAPLSELEKSLGVLLDTTFVGLSGLAAGEKDHRMKGWKGFSQKGDESSVTLSSGSTGFVESQALIVEYVVKTIFEREKSAKWPDHLLCDGFRRNGGLGLRVIRPNEYVAALQQSPWPQLLALLGESGDRIMIDLLLDCSVFHSLGAGTNNVCQISGKPLSNITTYRYKSAAEDKPTVKSPSELTFVRNRMFYARPALNARGQVCFGLRHIHILNRSPLQQPGGSHDVELPAHAAQENEAHTLKVMMYMFPRQFGLHNVFTSSVNFKETSQRLKDYTLREEEIVKKFGRLQDSNVRVKMPKRLRGHASDLVRKLQVLHQRCSYSQLLQRYCSIRLPTNEFHVHPETHKTQIHGRKSRSKRSKSATVLHNVVHSPPGCPRLPITGLATCPAQVSTFCQIVVKKVIPREFWGRGPNADHNESHFLKKVHQFICLRRFESMSLFELTQGMKINDMNWLASPRLISNKMSLSDVQKRRELLNEFLYFLFDSFLIPLIRSNFYVTESNTDKYRIFFFRHDVWRSLVEPAMATMKGKMLEEISLDEARRILDFRRLGVSHIRLLPKGGQMRAIANLRKRVPLRGNPKELGLGINKILTPAHAVFQLEKISNPQKLGSTMFNVNDMYKRMKAFKSRLSDVSAPIYLAKVDVQSAFDTIPQAAMVKLLGSIPQQRHYRLSKYHEIGTGFTVRRNGLRAKPRLVKKWPSVAIKNNDTSTFIERLDNGQATAKWNAAFVDLYSRNYEKSELLQLVTSHINQNLVKIGKKYYRQKQGIPQGSCLSAMLCNYFYADLEFHVLSFLHSDDCLLLRLTDDFLLITTSKEKAARFVEVLHQGVPEYGVTVNPDKSLVNFDLEINGRQVAKSDNGRFPYCGTLIDTRTLDIARASNEDQAKAIFDSLTVEFSQTPGYTFQRKVLNAFRIQSHLMFFDTELNSTSTVLKNVHRAFVGTATKMWAYVRCLPALRRPPPRLVIRTIQRLVDTAYLLLVSKKRRLRYPGYVCDIRKCEVTWLAYNAIHQVLARKPSGYGETLAWLEAKSVELSSLKNLRHGRIQTIL